MGMLGCDNSTRLELRDERRETFFRSEFPHWTGERVEEEGPTEVVVVVVVMLDGERRGEKERESPSVRQKQHDTQ